MTRYKQKCWGKKPMPIQLGLGDIYLRYYSTDNQAFAYDVKNKQHKWTYVLLDMLTVYVME